MKPIRWEPAKRGDAYAYYAGLRRQSPVIRARIPHRGTGWVVTRYADVAAVLKDPRFSNDPRLSAAPPLFGFGGPWAPRLLKLVGRSMVCADDPAHGRLRRLVAKAFTPRSIDQLEGWIAGVVEDLLDRAATRPTIDLVADFAVPLPLAVISEMLGIPDELRLDFHHQIVRLIEVDDKPLRRTLRWLPAMPRLTRFLEDLVALRRRMPDDRLISRLVGVEEAGDRLSEDELVGMIFLLLFAGHETTVNLIGSGVLALLDHPEQLAMLAARPDFWPAALEELLRFTNPVEAGTMRYAREPVTIAGVTIPKGGMVMALLSSANRDETAFAGADRLDIRRGDSGENRHVALGSGPHYCLGAALARLEGRVALAALLRRFPNLRLAIDREAVRWRVSGGLRGLERLPLHLA